MARRSIKEMFLRREPWSFGLWNGLRNSFRSLQRFYSTPTQPVLRKTTIDLEQARALYFNTEPSLSTGAHFAKPIIDVAADFMDMPTYYTANEALDTVLQECVTKYWKHSLREAWKLMMRDADCWVRIRGLPINSLTAENELNRVYLEPIVTERVVPTYNPFTKELEQIEVSNMVFIPDDDQEISVSRLNAPVVSKGVAGREHEIIEIITVDEFRYYDATEEIELEELRTTNEWGFISFVQFINEYDSALEGGTSDLENVYPFLVAHHEIFSQARTAHRQHSIPKVKFKIRDIMPFIQNNFPEAIDAQGNFTGKITWTGKEILFMESEDDAQFLEVSNKSDSVNLLEFIIDCIAVASERPEWVFMRNQGIEAQSSNSPQTLPFKKLITRKRENSEDSLIKLAKMALAIYGAGIIRPQVSWPTIEIADLAAEGQALSQITTSAEIANRAGVIDRATYRAKIAPFYPAIKSSALEESAAQKELKAEQDRQLEIAAKEAAIKAANTPDQTPPSSSKSNGKGSNSARSRVPLTVTPPGD